MTGRGLLVGRQRAMEGRARRGDVKDRADASARWGGRLGVMGVIVCRKVDTRQLVYRKVGGSAPGNGRRAEARRRLHGREGWAVMEKCMTGALAR